MSSYFNEKGEVILLVVARDIQDKKDNRPSLRREQTPGTNRSGDQNDKKKDDEQPTLHRRDG